MDVRKLKIPDENTWAGYESDLDVKYMHNLFFGKSIDEVQQYFGEGRSIERADELLFCPRLVFQYYIQAFAQYIQSGNSKGDSDSASPFLLLLKSREEKDPGSVKDIYSLLEPVVNYVATNQEYFDAPMDIYGDFQELANEIHKTCKA